MLIAGKMIFRLVSQAVCPDIRSMASSRFRVVAAIVTLALLSVPAGAPPVAQTVPGPEQPGGGLAAPASPTPADPPAPGAAPREGEAMERLYRDLADPANQNWAITEADIQREWSKSGSPAMDLLLRRGREAIEAGDPDAAIEHLTALTDHAPGFAEGWNARATAFYMKGRLGMAVADIQRALVLNPHHYGALSGLGLIFEQLNRPDMALAAFRASLAINPHQAAVIEAIGRLETADAGTAL